MSADDAYLVAEKLIIRLDETGGWLERLDGEAANDGKNFVLKRGPSGCEKRESYVRNLVVKQCLSRGWIRHKNKKFVLADEGQAFLKRRAGGADGFRAQHQSRKEGEAELQPGVRRPVTVNEAESPLGWLHSRKDKRGARLVSAEQLAAGERLARDFYLAQLSPRVTASLSALSSSRRERRSAPGSGAELSLRALEAKERLLGALQAVGPELSGVLLDVCCFSQGLEMAEKNAGWPQRSGKVVLQIALTALGRYYGLISGGDVTGPVRRRIQHWGTADYRPEIE